MRHALCLLALTVPALLGQNAAFEGIVTNTADGRPLVGAHIRVLLVNSQSQPPEAAYGAISQTGGRFSINPIPPGSYVLIPECRGFIYIGRSSVPAVVLKPGEHIADYKIEMTPRAVITGRVLDDFGDPVQNAFIEVKPAGDTRRGLDLYGFSSPTDDRGYFRWSGGPGQYFVIANLAGASPNPSGPDSGSAYARTWYPNAAGEAGALRVQAVASSESTIEIRLTRQRVLSITGTVSGMQAGAERGLVMLTSGENNSSTVSLSPDGRFAFRNIPAGIYTVHATIGDLVSLPREVRLEAADVDVQLSVAPAAVLRGTVEGPVAPGTAVRLSLERSGGFFSVPQAVVAKNGEFRLESIWPGKFKVTMDHLPENAYLKTVLLDGAAVTGDLLDFSGGVHASQLKLVVSPNGARVSGSVRDKKGEPIAAGMFIVIVSDGSENLMPAEPDGGHSSYSIKALRPGKYHIAAFDVLQFLDGAGDAAADYKKMLAASPEFEVKEGEQLKRDLTALTREDLNAKPQQ
ncbi:MAG TPA: hypothetical protein VN736_24520 [Candidatus Limnocylindrales bacterium]|nr:hypothetical protein [Candidatus Limnocylindrales bacterium]